MQLIILAAGKGSRLPKKFRNKPKCLVKISGKTILDHNSVFFKKFKSIHIITGYKQKYLKEYSDKKNIKTIHNKMYKYSNMVHSLFLSSKYIYTDTVICYGDIIFDYNIFNLLKQKKDIMPININWLNLWKKRMPLKKIADDAESLDIKNNKLTSIGEKISGKMPSYQYMGIFKLSKKSFFILKKYYQKLNNKEIDMTSFLNNALKQKKINFIIKKYKSYWYEIDTAKDIKVAEKAIK